MALWNELLPFAVERARQTYSHTDDCIYTKAGGPSDMLCSCGKGKDLPSTFVESMKPASKLGKKAVVHDSVYRAALSPLLASPAKFSAPELTRKHAAVTACGKCGKGGKNKQCARCHKVAYCSRECQRLHWKVHKSSCF